MFPALMILGEEGAGLSCTTPLATYNHNPVARRVAGMILQLRGILFVQPHHTILSVIS